jgi:hypothetical protein
VIGTMAHAAFIATAAVGAVYFLVARRVFDFWALAFFGSCFYFIPGFVGFAGYAEGLLLTEKPLDPEAHAVMLCVIAFSIAGGVISADDSNAMRPKAVRHDRIDNVVYSAVCTLFGLVGFLLTVATVGEQLLSADKFALLGALNRWHLLWTTGASIGLVMAFSERAWSIVALAVVLHVLNLLIGFRVDFVLSVLGCLFIFLRGLGPQRLVSHWKLVLGMAGLALSLFLFKYFMVAIQLMDMDLLLAQAANPDAIRGIFLYSEPFVAQGTLNEVIQTGYWVGPGHFAGIAYLFLPFANELGAVTTGFNDMFQPTLFSSVTEYGLGSNIWAEMIASGGWALLVVFLFLQGGLGLLLQRMVDRGGGALAAMSSLLIGYWAFYVHRNDLLYQMTLTRRFLLAAFLFWVVAVALAVIVRNVRKSGGQSVDPHAR